MKKFLFRLSQADGSSLYAKGDLAVITRLKCSVEANPEAVQLGYGLFLFPTIERLLEFGGESGWKVWLVEADSDDLMPIPDWMAPGLVFLQQLREHGPGRHRDEIALEYRMASQVYVRQFLGTREELLG